MTKCAMIGCGGELDLNYLILLNTGCRRMENTFACKKCRRIHSREGSPYFTSSGDPIYHAEGGGIEIVKEQQLEAWQFCSRKDQDMNNCSRAVLLGVVSQTSHLICVIGINVSFYDPKTHTWFEQKDIGGWVQKNFIKLKC
jgi:hypothetical protein